MFYHVYAKKKQFSLQIFHGVWTIAFFCLNVIESRAILPNASCLLAGYLASVVQLSKIKNCRTLNSMDNKS